MERFSTENQHVDGLCGINPTAVAEARLVLGPQPAAVAVAIAVQTASLPDDHKMKVNNARGYIRGMIAKAKDGQLRLERSVFGLLAQSSIQ